MVYDLTVSALANHVSPDGGGLDVLNILRFLGSHPLTRRSRLRAASRFVGWQIRSRLSDELIVPWIGGSKLAVRRGMRGATGNIYAGLHEFADMLFLLHFLTPEDLFLDIGANVGSYTILASAVRGARTRAFEPDPVTAGYLRRNIDLNAIGELAIVDEVALGRADTEVPLTVGRDTMNRVAKADEGNVRWVSQIRLDGIIEARAATMMKLDVEGYEGEVLRGCDACLSNDALMAIESEGVSEFILKTLDRHGFRRVHYDPYERAILNQPIGYPASNALFVRDEAAVTARLRAAPPVRVLGHSI